MYGNGGRFVGNVLLAISTAPGCIIVLHMDDQVAPSPYEEFNDLLPLLDQTLETMREVIQPLVLHDTHTKYQLSYLTGRLEHMKIVTGRLIRQNQRLIELAWMQEKYEPRRRPRSAFSKKLQAIFKESHELGLRMAIDLETLYVYGNLALDHWASVVGLIANVPDASEWSYPYAKLHGEIVKTVPPEGLRRLKLADEKDIYWLFYNLREFRNKFIEHIDRPLQKGSSRRTYYMGFNFYVPAASGSLTDEELAEQYARINHLQEPFVRNLPPNHWQRKPQVVLQSMVQRIETIENYEDRQLVLSVWKVVGGDSVSYEVLLRRFTKLLIDSASTLAGRPRIAGIES